jgi:hypothetical protein
MHHQKTPMPDPRRAIAAVPEDLAVFIQRATAKKADDRFESCEAAAQFLQTASELPLVHALELSTVAISYHPSRRKMVSNALEALHVQLDSTDGISLLWGHQESSPDDDDELIR